MLRQRVITALVLGACVFGILFFAPREAFNLLVAAVFSLAAWEWGRLSGIRSRLGQQVYPITLLATTMGILALQAQFGLPNWLPFGVAAVWWCTALLLVSQYKGGQVWWGGVEWRCLMGALVLIPTGLSLVFLRQLPKGEWVVALLFGVVAVMAIGAYFTGRAFGKLKLAPYVSPGKSWEGVAGGLFFTVVLAVLLTLKQNAHSFVACALLIMPAAAASVLGDLVESMVKRHQGVKDSSQLLPGHGGFMDRIDGLTAAAPIFTLSLLLTGWSLQ